MIITLDLTPIVGSIPYLLLGFGFGIAFYYMFYDKNSMTKLDRAKHDLEVKKEWFKMLAEQQKEKAKRERFKTRY